MRQIHHGQAKRRLEQLALAVSSTLAVTGPVLSAVVDVTWIGGGGWWYANAGWTGGVVPNNTAQTQYRVFMDGGNPTSQGANIDQMYTVDALTIDAGDEIDLVNKGKLTILGDVTSNGLLQLNQTSTLTIGASPAIPGGAWLNTGIVQMTGKCSIAANVSSFINTGVVTVSTTGSLLINGPWQNLGTINANGGTIGLGGEISIDAFSQIQNATGNNIILGTLDNTGRDFVIDSASPGWWVSGTLRGGRVITTAGNALKVKRIGANSPALDGVVLDGTINMATIAESLDIVGGGTLKGSG
ncbi:MAG: hypothetical protein ACREJC_06975, partial [Tepidisphaeraceae bacterium]